MERVEMKGWTIDWTRGIVPVAAEKRMMEHIRE